MQFFSYSFGKNYMFLLCNGLLAFIVKSSGLIGNSSPGSAFNSDTHATKIGKNMQQTELKLEQTKASSYSEEEVVMEVDDEEQGRSETSQLVEVKGDEELSISQDERENGFIKTADDQNEETIELLTTEELNKKCEDFIRRMREGIKFEAQQLVMV